MRNPYEVLGVPSTASSAEIRSAYRRVARQTHPDLHGGSPEYAAAFRDATDAYAILSDPQQRRRFDQTGSVDETAVSVSREEIYAAVAYVRSRAAEAKAAARSAALRGWSWFGAGAAITLFGYMAAASSPSGGSYPICWGAMLFGAIQGIRGFSAYSRIDRAARELEQNIWSIVTDSLGRDTQSAPTPSMAQAPGWYPDPTKRHPHRWWDGNAWTGHVSAGGETAWDPIQ